MTVSVASLGYYINRHAPDAPLALVEGIAVDVARKFCRDTLAWRSELSAMTVTQADYDYTITPPTDGLLVDIITAAIDTKLPLVSTTLKELEEHIPKWRTEEDIPEFVALSNTANEIIVAPASNKTYTSGMVITAAWQPTRGATTLPDILMDRFSDVLIDGGAAMLLAVPGTEWYDMNTAAFYKQKFDIGLGEAISKVADGHMRGVTRCMVYGGI